MELQGILEYVKPELLVLAVVLYLAGMGLKQTMVLKDKYIPLALGVAGIAMSGVYVLATCSFTGWQEMMMALFTAVTQGILVAGLSNYANQLVKQAGKNE